SKGLRSFYGRPSSANPTEHSFYNRRQVNVRHWLSFNYYLLHLLGTSIPVSCSSKYSITASTSSSDKSPLKEGISMSSFILGESWIQSRKFSSLNSKTPATVCLSAKPVKSGACPGGVLLSPMA